jgi:TIR domain
MGGQCLSDKCHNRIVPGLACSEGHLMFTDRSCESDRACAHLRGVGLPERLIEYLPSIFNQSIQYYSCFISYSTKHQEFAERIHADLQNKGVRCWFAPHEMPIGGKILDGIDAAIRLRDKLLLVMSERSIESDWVEDEVTKAFEEERKRKQIVLFPIRLDNAVIDTNEAWAVKLRCLGKGPTVSRT